MEKTRVGLDDGQRLLALVAVIHTLVHRGVCQVDGRAARARPLHHAGVVRHYWDREREPKKVNHDAGSDDSKH